MYRFLLTPRWWGINLFLVLAIPFCVFMGSWQLGRFEDRVESHEAAEKHNEEAGKGPARPLADLLPVDKETSGERATATGRWQRQLLVPERELDGKQGFYVLGLLKTDGGKTLPVVRGWLPGTAARGKAPEAPSGEVTVTGALQASENSGTDGVHKTGGLPDGQLGMISAASLVNLVPYEMYDAWITVDRAADGMTAVPPSAPQGSGLDLKAFQNLGYTGEWFIFAGFVVFMWFRLFRREVEFAKDAELGLVPPPETASGDEPEAPAGEEHAAVGGVQAKAPSGEKAGA